MFKNYHIKKEKKKVKKKKNPKTLLFLHIKNYIKIILEIFLFVKVEKGFNSWKPEF